MRPRFEADLACPPAAALQQLRARLDAPDAPCHGAFYGAHVVLTVPPQAQHYWSPQLSLDVERRDGRTHLHGLFAPRPAVWTLFVALYAMAGFGGLVGVLFGLSQWGLDQPAHALWAVPAALVLAGVAYGLALVGQRLGASQMRLLRTFLDDALADCTATPTAVPSNGQHRPVPS